MAALLAASLITVAVPPPNGQLRNYPPEEGQKFPLGQEAEPWAAEEQKRAGVLLRKEVLSLGRRRLGKALQPRFGHEPDLVIAESCFPVFSQSTPPEAPVPPVLAGPPSLFCRRRHPGDKNLV